ncbi:hypothetical protein VXS03_14205 [Photobacterium sp. S4TG1]|uniref:hypothetical protein n=1 Tax=Photobacterium sp. S4TG1 TaxID=3114587 RepID=UPI002E18FAC5|nr:hypothetical protein [Photobacterium sp. S4TG1]
MSALEQQLLLLGMADLPVDATIKRQFDQFISTASLHFDHVCQQRPNNTTIDLLLGFMTLHQRQAQQQWLQQCTAAAKMKTVFNDTLGCDNAAYFNHQDQSYLLALTHLWLMVQGATGIDYSYSNEQAEAQTHLLLHNTETTVSTVIDTKHDAFRCQLMQSYYLGKNHNKVKLSTRIKRLFRKV